MTLDSCGARAAKEKVSDPSDRTDMTVYAYIPTTTPGFCGETNIICNPDYGTSLARGSFSFQSGQWQNIMMVVQLNQIGTANGVLE